MGDASAGQFEEFSGYAYHIKRRLTAEELAQVGEPIDIRGTPEADMRQSAMRQYLPMSMRDWRE